MLIQVTSAISECSFQDWSPKLTIYHKLLFSRPKSKVYEITSWSPHNPDAGIKSKLKVDYLWNHNPDAGIKFDAVSSKYLPRQFYNLSPCLSPKQSILSVMQTIILKTGSSLISSLTTKWSKSPRGGPSICWMQAVCNVHKSAWLDLKISVWVKGQWLAGSVHIAQSHWTVCKFMQPLL